MGWVVLFKDIKDYDGPVAGTKRGSQRLFNGGVYPLVRFDHRKVAELVTSHRTVIDDVNVDTLCSVIQVPCLLGEYQHTDEDQIPLLLGWAMTVHRASGMSFNQAVVKVSSKYQSCL